ncbi:hypothetical protein BKA69DRAFT_395769 [Paraphysoderma sedebokerense]|nr:hypothetical protein BKA69DRAFT_395769 [Paraphysoderma sedebokerense]
MIFKYLSATKATYSILNFVILLSALAQTTLLVPLGFLDVSLAFWSSLKLGVQKILGYKKKYKCVVVTGASSGIGRQLALKFAQPGTHMVLIARDTRKLSDVANLCRRLGSTVDYESIDVRDHNAMKQYLISVDQMRPVDLVIANAGVAVTSTSGPTEPMEELYKSVLDTNFTGELNTITPLIHRMQHRRNGHIVLMSSLGGVQGFPNAPFYNAAKEGIYSLGRSLRYLMRPYNINVTTLAPGFVWTPAVEAMKEKGGSTAPPALAMSVEYASDVIKEGIENGLGTVIFPISEVVGAYSMRCLPLNVNEKLEYMLGPTGVFGKVVT